MNLMCMPIFVQWKWKERTRSFLVIFHFYVDGSELNLRMIKREGRNITTWAPSHLEMGCLMDVLKYANIIDGLNEAAKRELRKKLEILFVEDKRTSVYNGNAHKALRDTLPPNKIIRLTTSAAKSGFEESECCFELCPEYIDYLREVLNPYLRGR